MRKPIVAASMLLAFISVSATATETTTYTYDELGRLVATSNAGGPRNGKATATSFDPAGNRASHAVGQPAPPPTNAAVFSISGPSPVNEGGSVTFTVTKTGLASGGLTVNYATGNGTAAAPGDYTATSGQLYFLFWETMKQVSVATIDDGINEGAEQFSMNLSSPSPGASIGTATASATINSSGAANQPPVANTDALTPGIGVCLTGQKNVVANDTDPEGNYPLALVSVGTSSFGDVYIVDSNTVGISAYGTPGNSNVTYTVRDSLGATSTGLLTFSVVNGQGCN